MPEYREPLTDAQMRALWERNPSPEVRALLWEVFRLRGIALRAHQVSVMIGDQPDTFGPTFTRVLSILREQLSKDPAIIQRDAETKSLLDRR